MSNEQLPPEQSACKYCSVKPCICDPRCKSDLEYAETIPESERCKRCDGTGNELMFMFRRCRACEATGRSRGNEGSFYD